MKIQEYVLPNPGQDGFGFIVDPSTDTIHIGGGAYHWDIARAARLPEVDDRGIWQAGLPYLFGYIEEDGKVIYPHDENNDWLTPEWETKILRTLEPYKFKDPSYLNKEANIYDPIEEDLDKHVFKNGEPRDSVVNFIKRLYGRALKQEYGIENPEAFVDLYITGSLTTFQYSETSDCDISVFPIYEKFAQSFGEDSSKTRKRLVALSIEHIDGTFLPGTTHPLQFFVVADGIERQDLYQPGLRSAWSIYDEMWVVPPEKERSHDVAVEYPDAYSRASSMANKMRDALDRDAESARELWKMIHQKRQLDQMAGLGDYSEGNIVYKWLLHEGLFDRIRGELGEYIAQNKYEGYLENE